MLDLVEGESRLAGWKSDAAIIRGDKHVTIRFSGADPEPRPGLSSGHMPHSVSLPFTVLLSPPSSTQPSYKTVLPHDQLKTALLKALGGDQARLQALLDGQISVVNSCGSGMTAAIIWLALQELGVNSAIYDEVGLRHAHSK